MSFQFDYVIQEGGVRLTGFHGDAVHVIIPEEIGGLPVRVIGTHTFHEEGLFIESITVPSTVRVIETGAFELCFSLTELTLQEGLEVIGDGALQATGLEMVRIPASVQRIEGIAAIPCTLLFAANQSDDAGDRELSGTTEQTAGRTAYESDGFGIYHGDVLVGANAAHTPVTYRIRTGTTAIAPDVFAECGALEELIIPASLTELPEGALINVRDPFSLQRGIHCITVEAGNPVLSVQDGMLLRRMELLRYIGDDAEPVIPGTVVRIAQEAFLRTGVRRVRIPASVRAIGADAFLETPLEEAVFVQDTQPEAIPDRPDSADVRIGASSAWSVWFPQSDSFLLKNLLRAFGRNGKLYDFTTYDEILQEHHLNLDRVRMTCTRLENRIDLPEGRHAVLWASLCGRMEEIIPMIAEQNDLTLLKRLAGHGLITEANADRLIRCADRAERRETIAWLMDFKNRQFGTRTFDFSL